MDAGKVADVSGPWGPFWRGDWEEEARRNSSGVVSHGLLQIRCVAVAPHSSKAVLVMETNHQG